MKKNLKGRIALIVAVLVVFIYGIFGIPSGFTGQSLLAGVTKRIHLGLDLRGGAHLILQVVVSEAVSAETDSASARIQQNLKAANLTFSQVVKPDPTKPQIIRIDGTAPGQSSDIRSLLDSKYSNEYDVTGSDASFTVTMKPQVEQALEKKTVQQAIETIRDRVDSLGVSEPVIQEYGLGENQILVELPGIEDLDRVKNIIQSTARLEIHPVVGGPYQDEQSALASVGGVLPPDEQLSHFFRHAGVGLRQRLRAPARTCCRWQRLPIRRSQHERHRPARCPFHTDERGRRDRFYDYNQRQRRPRHGRRPWRPRA